MGRHRLIVTPYVEGRIIYGVIRKQRMQKTDTKPAMISAGRKRRKRGIFTKQSGGIEYEH